MRTTIPAALVLALSACNPVVVKPAEDGPPCGRGLRCSYKSTHVQSVAAVDLLFVIDNSGSMAASQAKLAASVDVLLDQLQDSHLELDLRVAFTTTDQGNPLCPGTEPEGGDLVLSSCLDRVEAGEFIFDGVDPPLDGTFACTDSCSLSDAALAILPTTTPGDQEPKPRSWIELAAGATNLPAGVELAEALACFAPQGIAGCGFESQLESMYRALLESDDPEHSNGGFLRPWATLAIVFLTDEVDCSSNPAHEAVFLTEKALWSDPEAAAPTSALCWRAGVECLGDPAGYDSCAAVNVGVDGSVGVDSEEAVLYPAARYIEGLQLLEEERRQYDAGAEVLVAVIGGVPQDYAGDELTYSAAGEQAHLDEFGVDPGCVDPDGGAALAPVRLHELAEAQRVGERSNLFSSCAPDYAPALAAIGDLVKEQMRPACMPECVQDVDTTTEIVDIDCSLREENIATGEVREIPRCEGEGESRTPPEDEASCWYPLVDPGGQTPSTADDMSAYCVEEGWNLEFGFVRTGPTVQFATTTVDCKLSDLPAVDCPDLGG